MEKGLFGVEACGWQIVLGCFGGKYSKYNNRQRVHHTGSHPSSFGRSRGWSCVFFSLLRDSPKVPILSSPIKSYHFGANITLRTTKRTILMQPLRTPLMSLHCALALLDVKTNTC